MDSGRIRPCIEVEPSKFIVVVGPRLAEAVLSEAVVTAKGAKLPALSLTAMVSEGVSVLLDAKKFQQEAERAECEKLYRSAFQVDPLPKLLTNLHHCGGYAAWLERCFQLRVETTKNNSPTLNRLLELQSEGALLVYTGCDDVLSKLASQRVLLPSEDFASWVKGEKKGFLNVHGVYWRPETLQLQCEGYLDPNYPSRMAMGHLEQLFQQRSVIAVGTCDPTDLANPMLAMFARSFLFSASSNVTSRQYRFHLSLDPRSTASGGSLREISGSRCILNLPQFRSPFQDYERMGWIIFSLRSQARALYEELDLPPGGLPDHHMLSLLVKTKRGASEVSKMTFDSPGANFALVSSVTSGVEQLSHTVTIRVEAAKLSEFWDWLWVEKREGLIKEGLLAVVLQTGAILWCQANTEGHDSGAVVADIPMDSSHHHEVKYSHQMKEAVVMSGGGGVSMPMEFQHKHMNQDKSVTAPLYKSLSPLVMQEFPTAKPGKLIPRYTVVHKNKVSAGGRNSLTLPANGFSSSSCQHKTLSGSSDDMGVHKDLLSKASDRRSSLPQQILSNSHLGSSSSSSMDSRLFTLAEHCQNASSVHPPSYVAIKQALLCDQYQRRPSVQSDPKTLKNLLKTKLVISEDSNDIVNQRRKSDPGSYVKQRDFERRKELFLDENLSWAKSYGKVIDQQIGRWQQKRQEKQLQREMRNWQQAQAAAASASLSQQLQLQMLNHPLVTGQPMQFADGLTTVNPTSLLSGNLAASGGGVPYLFPQAILPGSVGTTTATPPLYYNPSYALINPFAAAAAATVQLGQVQPATAAAQAGTFYLPTQQPRVVYYLPTSSTTSSTNSSPSSSLSSSSATATNSYSFPVQHQLSSSSPPASFSDNLVNTTTTSSSNSTPGSTSSPPRISLNAPPMHHHQGSPASPWITDHTQFGNDLHKLQPVSPGSRKRHQSVPEKLTSLLQPPLPIIMAATSIPSAPPSTSSMSSGRSSPMDEGLEGNPDSPPLSKKQRSTSDTTVYHSSIRMHQLSPGRGRSPTPLSQGSSPQPPQGGNVASTVTLQGGTEGSPLEGGLSPFQAHLLQVHQSYGISRSAVEERKRRHMISRDKRGHSPLRKLSGGSLSNGRKYSAGSGTNGSMSPTPSLVEEGPMDGTGTVAGSTLAGVLQENRREVGSDMEEREAGSETGSEHGYSNDNSSPQPQHQLWHYMLELLLHSSNSGVIHWTDNEFEFRINQPLELAHHWGQYTSTPGMNYDQLYAGISCHFREGILSQVQDRKLTFKFDGQVQDYVRTRRLQAANAQQQDVEGELVVVV